jgi:hypothetical protein
MAGEPRLALQRYHGAGRSPPFRSFGSYLPGLPGGRVTSRYEVLPGQISKGA